MAAIASESATVVMTVATMVVKESTVVAIDVSERVIADAEEHVSARMMTAVATEDLYLTEETMTLADANVRMIDFPKRKAYLQA